MGLEYSLEQAGFATKTTVTATAAKHLIETSLDQIDCALIDINLPDGNGYEICREIKAKLDLPVIFLTAQDDEVNVVMGLDMGADDYITKPFRVRELISRIQSVMRRYERQLSTTDSVPKILSTEQTPIQFASIRIHPSEARVYKDQDEIVLTSLEYKLLLVFAKHKGMILSRNQLLEQIWDAGGAFVNDNTLTVYIKRLREKLEDDPREPTLIKTVRGLGYQAGG